jgi:hypothetical protein
MFSRFQCDICHRFVALKDLANGTATRRCISDDTEFSKEEYETLCVMCVKKKENPLAMIPYYVKEKIEKG